MPAALTQRKDKTIALSGKVWQCANHTAGVPSSDRYMLEEKAAEIPSTLTRIEMISIFPPLLSNIRNIQSLI